MGRDRRLHLVRRHGGTPGEGQQDEERGEPFMQVHCTKTVSIRLGSLFLTLPTRGLTEQNFISSPTRRRLIRSAPRRGRGSRAGRSGRAAWAVFRLMTSSNLSGCSTGPVARPRFPQNVACGDRARNRKFADLYGSFSVKWFFVVPVPCLERKGRSSSRRLRSGSRSARKVSRDRNASAA